VVSRAQGPVGAVRPGTRDLAAQDGELVARHEGLEVVGSVAAAEQGEQLDGAAQRQGGGVG
jgi:hypothetical protein